MKNVLHIVLAYLLACPLTSMVSLDLTQTEWTNILTYLWIAFAGVIWTLIVFVVFLFIAAVVSK